MFIVPDSSTSVNAGVFIGDRLGSGLRGIFLEPARVSGASTSPHISVDSSGTGTLTTFYYNAVAYANLVSNGSNYLEAVGTSSGGTPYVRALGVDTDVNVRLYPQGAGVVSFYYGGTALGGGAAATLGTIGGSGPQVAGQSFWLEISVSASTARYFLPVWST